MFSQPHVSSALRGLLLFAAAIAILSILFWVFRPEYRDSAPIPATGGDTTLVVEGSKEFDSIVTILTTLTTGLFVLVALVAGNPLRPTIRPSAGQLVLMTVFVVSASGIFYTAMHVKYALSEGLLAKSLDLPLIGAQIGVQAWFVAFAGAAAVALVADALLTVKQ